ncbi:MAG: hypothetical protein AAF717_17390 [Bacteroidota bacterium]
MHFNWILPDQLDQNLKKRCIELEYALRPKLTRFLLDRFETDCCGDFSCFYFDVEVATGIVRISRKTPWEFRRTAMKDFDLQFNTNNTNRVA